jgi:hypothetical protein
LIAARFTDFGPLNYDPGSGQKTSMDKMNKNIIIPALFIILFLNPLAGTSICGQGASHNKVIQKNIEKLFQKTFAIRNFSSLVTRYNSIAESIKKYGSPPKWFSSEPENFKIFIREYEFYENTFFSDSQKDIERYTESVEDLEILRDELYFYEVFHRLFEQNGPTFVQKYFEKIKKRLSIIGASVEKAKKLEDLSVIDADEIRLVKSVEFSRLRLETPLLEEKYLLVDGYRPYANYSRHCTEKEVKIGCVIDMVRILFGLHRNTRTTGHVILTRPALSTSFSLAVQDTGGRELPSFRPMRQFRRKDSAHKRLREIYHSAEIILKLGCGNVSFEVDIVAFENSAQYLESRQNMNPLVMYEEVENIEGINLSQMWWPDSIGNIYAYLIPADPYMVIIYSDELWEKWDDTSKKALYNFCRFLAI